MTTRLLTVEPFGDFFGKTITASAVRLKGKWLQRAGFLPGQQVFLKIVGQGAIELRVQIPSETPDKPPNGCACKTPSTAQAAKS